MNLRRNLPSDLPKTSLLVSEIIRKHFKEDNEIHIGRKTGDKYLKGVFIFVPGSTTNGLIFVLKNVTTMHRKSISFLVY